MNEIRQIVKRSPARQVSKKKNRYRKVCTIGHGVVTDQGITASSLYPGTNKKWLRIKDSTRGKTWVAWVEEKYTNYLKWDSVRTGDVLCNLAVLEDVSSRDSKKFIDADSQFRILERASTWQTFEKEVNPQASLF